MPRYSAATFRTLGIAATTQNLFTIENQEDSLVVVRIRRLVTQMDATATLTSFMPLIKTSRCDGLPSNGTELTKAKFDTGEVASNAAVVVRGSTGSDGGVADALLATPADILWQQFGMRMHSAVGQILGLDNNSLPTIVEDIPVVLRENEALLVHIVAFAAASNPITNHYFVEVVWDEDAT